MDVKPEVVINALLDQIRQLTFENVTLRAALAEYEKQEAARQESSGNPTL